MPTTNTPQNTETEKPPSRQKLFYAKKIRENIEFYESEKLRVKEANKKKYAEDPVFREKQRERARANYKKQKEAREAALASIESVL